MKKQKILLALIRISPVYIVFQLLVLIPLFTMSQQLSPVVISTAGESFTANGYSLDFVIGELAIESYQNETSMLTQGFLQGDEGATSINEFAINDTDIHIYPNPASNNINIEVYSQEKVIHYEIVSLQGAAICRTQLVDNISTTDISFLKPGMYLLCLYFKGHHPVTKTFIKQ